MNIAEKRALFLLASIALLAFLWNLGLNDIWTPNEGFYADAAREMLEANNFLEIFYNYAPRYNKPPLMYWLIALLGKGFGLNETTVRLPSALAGLGTVYLVYCMGKLLHSPRLGIWAALVMAFSFQFAINARYATPEIVLTFFMSLTIFWFLQAYQSKKTLPLFLAYLALGLAVLTKGYPYMVVTGGIILVFLLLESQGRWKEFLAQLRFLRLHWGIPLVLLVGMSWVLYMYATHGADFHEVFMNETFRRAFTRKSSFKPFFYLEATLWGFLPYALTFYAALIAFLITRGRDLKTAPVLRLGLAWFGVMLLIFTAAKGKIPTYFIQAHPGMALWTAWFMLSFQPSGKSWQALALQLSYFLPGIGLFAGSFGLVYLFKGHPLLYGIAMLPLFLLWIGKRFRISLLQLEAFPFYAFGVMYFIFTVTTMPYMEKFRPHEAIGKIIRQEVPDASVPVMVQEYNLHNLPYYAGRKMWEYSTPEMVRARQKKGPLLLLVRDEYAGDYGPGKILWEGFLYEGSETRTLEFILQCLARERGAPHRFSPFKLIYQENPEALPL